MKEGIHPDYKPAKIICACGAVWETCSTKEDIHVEVCSKCHPSTLAVRNLSTPVVVSIVSKNVLAWNNRKLKARQRRAFFLSV